MNINLIGLILNVLAGILAGVSVAWGAGVHSGSGLVSAGVIGAAPAVSGFLTKRSKNTGGVNIASLPAPVQDLLLATADEIKRQQVLQKQAQREQAKAIQTAQQAAAQQAAELRAQADALEASISAGITK